MRGRIGILTAMAIGATLAAATPAMAAKYDFSYSTFNAWVGDPVSASGSFEIDVAGNLTGASGTIMLGSQSYGIVSGVGSLANANVGLDFLGIVDPSTGMGPDLTIGLGVSTVQPTYSNLSVAEFSVPPETFSLGLGTFTASLAADVGSTKDSGGAPSPQENALAALALAAAATLFLKRRRGNAEA